MRLRHIRRIKRNELRDPLFIMTVDVDGWSSLLNFYSVSHDPSIADVQVSVEEGIDRLLQVFDKHEIRATFFVSGEMAKRHRQAVRRIHQDGHEVACHGLIHGENEFLETRQKQEQNIRKATQIIQEIVGRRPVGFRAPCLRANETTLEVLEECGYVYDSSVVPTFVPGYYGNMFAPLNPYHPSSLFMAKEGSYGLLEIPLSVNPFVPLPLSAAWMRNLGLLWVKLGVKMNFMFGHPVVFYVHPRDVISLPKVKGVPWHLYRNVGYSGVRMVDEVVRYAKKLGAGFMRAVNFAEYWKFHVEKS